MSRYEDYTSVAKSYDETRLPIGIDILRQCLELADFPLVEMALLDAGCGTGAYTAALLPHVGHIEAVDLSEDMLAVARAKLADEEAVGRVAFRKASIDALPFEAGSFDAAIINQVLHHLADEKDASFSAHRAVIREMHRVLRPGGVLVVNTCTIEQLAYGYWYYDLVPEARDASIRRHIPADRLESMLADAGFEPCAPKVPEDAVMQGGAYFDPIGPLRESWRRGDSFWALATPDQIARAEDRVRKMLDDGTLRRWFQERDARREAVGQFTFFPAIKRVQPNKV